ncbi:MAG TPA: hypothetical protein PLD62_00185 [Candidatus Cloacimonadota bacterium]|nr:hypothetical protein [Candidatus Cloacimonadota bacterium]
MKKIIFCVCILSFVVTLQLFSKEDEVEKIKKSIYCLDKYLSDNLSFEVECQEINSSIEINLKYFNSNFAVVEKNYTKNIWEIAYNQSGLNVTEPEIKLIIIDDYWLEDEEIYDIEDYNLELLRDKQAVTQILYQIFQNYFYYGIENDTISVYQLEDENTLTRTLTTSINGIDGSAIFHYKKFENLFVVNDIEYFEKNPQFDIEQTMEFHYDFNVDHVLKPEKAVTKIVIKKGEYTLRTIDRTFSITKWNIN